MTRRVDLPDEHHVRQARDALLTAAAANGTRPSVVALARTLGLSNTTFWRHYPHIARELADARRDTVTTTDPGAIYSASATDPSPRPVRADDTAAALRRENRALRTDLEQAATTIARLTLENHQLRHELEHARGVHVLHRDGHDDRRPPPRPTEPS